MKFSVFSLISMFMVTANALATPTDPEDDAPKLIKRADRPWPPSKPWPPTFPRPSFPPQLIHPLAANTTEIIIPKPRTTTTHPLGPTHGPAHKPWPSLPPQFQHFKPSPDPTPEPELVPEPTHTPPPPPPSPPGGAWA
ncbi:hypothetical protein BASA62_007880 [Batrachochytrium salamandrivorans]|nr:hypothetical protein BASA62_007880 [Batrachochytrium salamandrivorans]